MSKPRTQDTVESLSHEMAKAFDYYDAKTYARSLRDDINYGSRVTWSERSDTGWGDLGRRINLVIRAGQAAKKKA